MSQRKLHDVGRTLGDGSFTPNMEWGRRTDADAHRVLVDSSPVVIDPPTGAPTIELDRNTLTFNAVVGGINPAPQVVETWNVGTGSFQNYTIVCSESWLSTVPISGSGAPTIDVSVNIAGLTSSGRYNATITFTVPGATNSPQVITVELILAPSSALTYPPINKQLFLGYFFVSSRYGELTSTAIPGAANNAVSLGYGGDYMDGDGNEDPNWASKQRAAVDVLIANGATAFIGCNAQEVANLTSRWSAVEGFYASLEAMPGATTLEKTYALERVIRTARKAVFDAGLPNRPVLVYFNSAQCMDPNWILPDGCDYIGVESYLTAPGPATAAEAKAQMKTLIATRLATLRAKLNPDWKVPFTIIAQAYDRNGTWTDATTLAGLQTAFSEVAAEQSDVNGIVYFSYGRPGGTANYLNVRLEHEAIFRSLKNGKAAPTTPSFPAYGVLEVVNASTISGWAFDPDRPNNVIQVQIFDRPRRVAGAVRLAQLAPSDPRPDIVADTRDLGLHGFSIPTPSTIKDNLPHDVWAYGVNYGFPVGQQNPLVNSPITVTIAGSPNELTASGNAILKGGSSFLYKSASCFSAIREMIDHGANAMDAKLNYWQSKGVTALRCFGMLGATNHGANAFNSSEAGYDAAWRNLLTAAQARGIVIEATLLADTAELTDVDTPGERLTYVKRMATLFGPYWNVMVEIANEPWHPTQNFGSTLTELVSLASAMKTINPNRLYSLGCPEDRMSLSTAIPPANYITSHASRYGPNWQWIQELAQANYPPITQANYPLGSNEPENATRTGGTPDPSEARWYCFGALAQLRRFHSTFHYGDGKYTILPDATTETLLDRWLQGIGEFNYNYGGTLFIGTNPTNGQSLLRDTGDILFVVGRRLSSTGVALVVAQNGFSPSAIPGWAATTTRTISETSYNAYRVTFTT